MIKEQSRLVGDWYELTEAEAAVFGIQSDLEKPLLRAFMAYEAIIGISDEGWPAGTSEAQAEQWRSRYQLTLKQFDDYPAARFMSEVFDLPRDQCFAWIRKHEAWLLRNGLMILT